MSLRIERAEVSTCDLRLTVPFRRATSGALRCLEEVYVKLTADGVVDWGEVPGNRGYTTGETSAAVFGGLAVLLPILVERDPLDRTGLMLEFDRAPRANWGAKSAIEDALCDLGGKLLGVPVHALLGGALVDRLPSNQAIGFGDPGEAAGLAREFVGRGFRHLKVRVGMEPFERDVERLRTVREAVGPDLGAADLLHLKLGKLGGIGKAGEIMALARAAGVGVMMGQMNEGALATVSAAHRAAASEARSFDFYGTEGIERDPASGLEWDHGSLVPGDHSGFGIEVDEAMLDRVHQIPRSR